MGNSVSYPIGLRTEDSPSVKAQIFTWSSEEFQNEYALLYTSRSNPSLTCLSYVARNHNKVRFILHDCLCTGNNVRIGIEFEKNGIYNGTLAFGPTRIDVSSGNFIVQKQEPGNYLWKYQDRFGRRVDQLWLRIIQNGLWEIQFNTSRDGVNSFLAYVLRIVFNPYKGLDVVLSYPYFEYVTLGYYRRPFALCRFDLVTGKPPHDVLKQANVVSNNSGRSDNNNNDDDGAPPSSTQNNVIVNKGIAPGILNGSNININL